MTLCKHCRYIDLVSLWTTKSPRFHQPSFLALTFSAEDCPGCDIILDCLPSPPVAGLPLPTLFAPSAPLVLATANEYKYAATVADSPVNIDSLLFYFDDQKQIQDLNGLRRGKPHKADPKYFGRWLDVYADSPAALGYIVGRPVKSMLDHSTISEWFTECKGNHPECSEYSDLDTLHKSDFPSRLIDVSPKEGVIRLVQSAIKGTGQKYLTLSHRWTNNMATTTQRSLSAYQKSLPLERLSQCFRDAIKITQQLGFRYIWIDALCIVQDAPADVQRECAHMKDIYQNCTIMLAADRAEHSDAGLYLARQDSKETLLPFHDADGEHVSQFTLSNRQLGTFESDVIRGVLSSRGWTLQERILAPRILHFGKSQLHWECRTSIWWERTDFKRTFYTPRVLDDAREIMTAMSRKKLGTPSAGDMVGMGEGCTDYTTWYDLVSAYSCRKLTLPEDRLTAILGLADLFLGIIQDRFVWGLWHQDLPAGLLWTVQATAPLARLAAPSWSWASIDGELTFHIPSTKWGRPLRGTLRRTCESVVLADSVALHGTYHNGRLSCRCPVKLVALAATAGIGENEEDPFDHLRQEPNAEVRDDGSRRIIGNATLDDDALLPTPDTLQPLRLHAAMLYRQYPLLNDGRMKQHRKRTSVSYCILLKLLVEDGLFRRCGYAEIQPEAFSGVEMSNIAIV